MTKIRTTAQVIADLDAFSQFAMESGWDDERGIAVCELFLQLRDVFAELDKADGDVH